MPIEKNGTSFPELWYIYIQVIRISTLLTLWLIICMWRDGKKSIAMGGKVGQKCRKFLLSPLSIKHKNMENKTYKFGINKRERQ